MTRGIEVLTTELLYEYLLETGPQTVGEVAEISGVSYWTADRKMRALLDTGRVRIIGETDPLDPGKPARLFTAVEQSDAD